MRHKDSCDWRWDPKIQALFAALGLTWKVLKEGRILTTKQLGSSPGECIYTGTVFVFEYACPEEYVLHELAHWLVARRDRLKDTKRRNYGYERGKRNRSHPAWTWGPLAHTGVGQQPWATNDDEIASSLVTCGLARRFEVNDYKKIAELLSVGQELTREITPLPPDDLILAEITRRIDAASDTYLGGITLSKDLGW